MRYIRGVAIVALVLPVFVFSGNLRGSQAAGEGSKRFVGSEACKDCHETEYKNFTSYARKAHSYKSIKALAKGLTDQEIKKCYECHTTGYGKEGGFRSESETPQLKDAGCEVCHGPGSLHCDTSDPKDVKGKLTAKDCETCHSSERIQAFRYRPLVYGGAH